MVKLPIAPGPELLLDTWVYIDVLQGRTPVRVDEFLETRIVNHSTICLAEMTHLFGRLDLAHAGTKTVLHEIRRTIDDMPDHRHSSPSEGAMGDAGMLAGLMSRRLGVNRHDQQLLLNDASLSLQAVERD
jgi:hypothetical protein